ncbi:MAG: tetratricopeptide repeat protein, partial [Planctomycetota bacterium]
RPTPRRRPRPAADRISGLGARAPGWAAGPPAALRAEGPVDPPRAFDALREGRYEEAVEAFRKWAEAEPGASEPFRGWAEALAAVGRYEEALQALRSSKRRDSSAALRSFEGRVHLRLGRLREAEEAFRAALEADPKNPEAWNRLGESLSKQGRKEEAEAAWKRVVRVYEAMSGEEAERLRPEDFVEMALALIGLNRWSEANEVMLAQAKEKDQSCPAALLESGRALLAKYNYPDSRFELRAAIDENPFFADALALLAENQLADFQLGSERFRLAEKFAERALAVNPRHAEAHAVRGALWLYDGHVERAADDFRRAVEIDPSSLRARGLLAVCHYLRGDEDALRAAEKEALAVNPRGAGFFHALALGIEGKFRYADCVRYCDRALEVDPEYWPAYVTLAINCLRTGEEARGREFLEKSWEHDKFNVWVYNTRKLLRHMDENFQVLETGRFVFKFPKADFEVLKALLVPHLERAYDKISERYGVTLSPPIYVEAFSEHKWFSARTVGLEGLAAAGACFGRLITLATPRALPQNWGAVSQHEFAHVVTLAASRQRVPRWLTEGCSVYEEGRDRPDQARVFDREIADAFRSGLLLPMAELDFGFSKPKHPRQILLSYFQGCLVVQYVAERWGFDAVRKLLRAYGEDKSTRAVFEEVFGLSLEEFDRGFFAYVAEWVAKTGYEPEISSEAIPRLEAAVEADPGGVEKLVELAWAYHTNRIRVDVPLTVEKIFAIRPDHPDGHAILGLEHLAAKKPERAKEHLEKALAGGTRFPYRVHAALGEIALGAGDKAGAIEHFERAKAISPRAGAAYPPGRNLYYRLAELYEAAGDREKAVREMEALSRFAPEDALCRKAIYEHYRSKDDPESVRKTLEALDGILYIQPFDPRLHEALARVAARAGAHEIAIREYRYLLTLPGADRKAAYEALAEAHRARGEREEARAAVEKLLELDPENAAARRVLSDGDGKEERID